MGRLKYDMIRRERMLMFQSSLFLILLSEADAENTKLPCLWDVDNK